MRCSEEELLAIEVGFRKHEQQEIFRMARFDGLVAQIAARKADDSIDGWRHYLNGELKALGLSDAEILAGLDQQGARACEG